MAFHTFAGRYNCTEAELKSLNSKIVSAQVNNNNIIIQANNLNDTDLDLIFDFLKTRRYNEKTEYSKQVLDSDKIKFMEEKLRLK